jgi:hypothetical protein
VPPEPPAADFGAALRLLVEGNVPFIVVGGLAAVAHGSARVTYDLDVVYSRAPEAIERLARTLAPVHPYLRGAPPGLPFRWDGQTVLRGLNFTLTTDLGPIDLLGEIAGGGTYELLVADTVTVTAFGVQVLCLGLRKLIEVKRAAGRPKDLEAIAELEILLEEPPS